MLTFYRNLFAPPRDLILVVASIWFGLFLAEKHSARHGISTVDLNNLVFYPLFGFIFGGRILYILENLSAFLQNFNSLISLNLDLFDPFGGTFAAGIVALIYGQRRKLPFWPALDALTPVLAVLALGLGLAHLASGSAFGRETSLPWKMELWGAYRHPSQVYESLAAFLILCLLWFLRLDTHPGLTFLTFSALTSATRIFLEAFRGDSTLILGGLRSAQVVAWIVLAISLILMDSKYRTTPPDMVIRKK